MKKYDPVKIEFIKVQAVDIIAISKDDPYEGELD